MLRKILMVGFLLACSLSMQAATITLLSRTQRDGTVTSASTVLPAGITSILVSGTVDNVDLTDATLRIGIYIEYSLDGGLTWQVLFGAEWRGGGAEPSQPEVQFGWDGVGGKRIRCRLDISKQTRVVITATFSFYETAWLGLSLGGIMRRCNKSGWHSGDCDGNRCRHSNV